MECAKVQRYVLPKDMFCLWKLTDWPLRSSLSIRICLFNLHCHFGFLMEKCIHSKFQQHFNRPNANTFRSYWNYFLMNRKFLNLMCLKNFNVVCFRKSFLPIFQILSKCWCNPHQTLAGIQNCGCQLKVQLVILKNTYQKAVSFLKLARELC